MLNLKRESSITLWIQCYKPYILHGVMWYLSTSNLIALVNFTPIFIFYLLTTSIFPSLKLPRFQRNRQKGKPLLFCSVQWKYTLDKRHFGNFPMEIIKLSIYLSFFVTPAQSIVLPWLWLILLKMSNNAFGERYCDHVIAVLCVKTEETSSDSHMYSGCSNIWVGMPFVLINKKRPNGNFSYWGFFLSYGLWDYQCTFDR